MYAGICKYGAKRTILFDSCSYGCLYFLTIACVGCNKQYPVAKFIVEFVSQFFVDV